MKNLSLFLIGFCLCSAAYSYPDMFSVSFNLLFAGLNYWSYKQQA